MKIATDIMWDIDFEDTLYDLDLPTRVVLPDDIDDDDIADLLSDDYGYCVETFCIEEVDEI